MISKKKKFIAIIPARSGSKGLKNKNILNVSGHPLISYSIQAAKESIEEDTKNEDVFFASYLLYIIYYRL